MDNVKIANELIIIAKKIQAREIIDLKSMGGGINEPYSEISRDGEFSLEFGTYSGGDKKKWVKNVDFAWDDRKEINEARSEVSDALKKVFEKLDKDVVSTMKKLGYK